MSTENAAAQIADEPRFYVVFILRAGFRGYEVAGIFSKGDEAETLRRAYQEKTYIRAVPRAQLLTMKAIKQVLIEEQIAELSEPIGKLVLMAETRPPSWWQKFLWQFQRWE